MSQPINAVCDGCNKEFEVSTQVENTEDGSEKNYFVCPHCGKEYVAFIINQSIRTKQAEMKMLWRKLKSATTLKQHNKLHEKIEQLEKSIKQEIQKLKEVAK
ncbi:hypothetical protein PUS82_15355 [Cytobacillus firmus]|uniref:hypothetical protein n=1 Tax=Cytobacillus firmus TaxID=1399 RepID=UPI00237ABDC2|nr:hypothetical protein [Cytobacillus firmus]MDD9312651.1 hypothetical protein [Cytobacillus firmus]